MPKLTPPVNKNDHIHGPVNASLELVEYGDYQCPHCGAAHPVVRQIQKKFGRHLKFVFRHFPLSNVHEYALPAAIAAEAAARQDKFWQMHDIIFENQSLLSDQAFIEFALAIGLNIPAFRMDVMDEALAEKIETNFESGVRSGVNGTPSFFINGMKYNGSFDYAPLSEILETQEALYS
jgi:protein-disulfide isomerase